LLQLLIFSLLLAVFWLELKYFMNGTKAPNPVPLDEILVPLG